jgi:NAD(P)-dependent dehydrogenase (short-subunit alcohol dehydrogenase family)
VPLDEKRRLATSRRIVVAGTSGPGAGIAAALAADGARVAVLEPAAEGAVAPLHESIQRVACDFTSSSAVATGVLAAVEALGGIDQFVYAWYPDELTETTTFMEVPEEEWARVCEGALDAAWWLVRSLIGPLRASDGGSIVFVVPTVGRVRLCDALGRGRRPPGAGQGLWALLGGGRRGRQHAGDVARLVGGTRPRPTAPS